MLKAGYTLKQLINGIIGNYNTVTGGTVADIDFQWIASFILILLCFYMFFKIIFLAFRIFDK